MLDKTNELSKLNKELEDNIESGPELFAVANIEDVIGKARTIFEQRMEGN